jgi:hypothetical protein
LRPTWRKCKYKKRLNSKKLKIKKAPTKKKLDNNIMFRVAKNNPSEQEIKEEKKAFFGAIECFLIMSRFLNGLKFG